MQSVHSRVVSLGVLSRPCPGNERWPSNTGRSSCNSLRTSTASAAHYRQSRSPCRWRHWSAARANMAAPWWSRAVWGQHRRRTAQSCMRYSNICAGAGTGSVVRTSEASWRCRRRCWPLTSTRAEGREELAGLCLFQPFLCFFFVSDVSETRIICSTSHVSDYDVTDVDDGHVLLLLATFTCHFWNGETACY